MVFRLYRLVGTELGARCYILKVPMSFPELAEEDVQQFIWEASQECEWLIPENILDHLCQMMQGWEWEEDTSVIHVDW